MRRIRLASAPVSVWQTPCSHVASQHPHWKSRHRLAQRIFDPSLDVEQTVNDQQASVGLRMALPGYL